MDDPTTQCPAAISSAQSDAVTIVGGAAARGVVVLCDHASNALPPAYGTLGLDEAQLQRHIAYDIGAEAVARGLAASLGAPAVLSRYSRLLIDPNRGDDDPTLIMRISDGAVIAGNKVLSEAERALRKQRYYDPYHEAVTAVIDACLAYGRPPVLVSIHSFTPCWKGLPRPWHAGILWDQDPRLAMPLLEALRAEPGMVVGDNEPYSGVLKGDTLWQHGSQRGLAHAIIEVRQDLIAAEAGQRDWTQRLAAIVSRLLDNPGHAAQLHEIIHFGSRTDCVPTQSPTAQQPNKGRP